MFRNRRRLSIKCKYNSKQHSVTRATTSTSALVMSAQMDVPTYRLCIAFLRHHIPIDLVTQSNMVKLIRWICCCQLQSELLVTGHAINPLLDYHRPVTPQRSFPTIKPFYSTTGAINRFPLRYLSSIR